VRKYPGLPPKFSNERMAILEFNLSDCGFAYVGNHVVRADWVVSDQFRHWRIRCGAMVDEASCRRALKKCDAPAVCMFIGQAASFGKAFKRKLDVGWRVAVHPEQLTHGLIGKLLIN